MRVQGSGRARGFSVGTTLVVAFVALLIGSTLAALTTMNLQFASGYMGQMQAEMAARSVVAQFIHEQDQLPSHPLEPNAAPALRTRYHDRPVFPSPAPELPGRVAVTFDPGQPYFSVDNSQGDRPAAGWNDRGTTSCSIPPYSVDLIISVEAAGRTYRYEAIIQRKWPYVLTFPATAELSPIFAMSLGPTGTWQSTGQPVPTIVDGAVFCVNRSVQLPNTELSLPVLFQVPAVPQAGSLPLPVAAHPPGPETSQQVLCQLARASAQRNKVNDNVGVVVGPSLLGGLLGAQFGTGTRLHGRVDFAGSPPPVPVQVMPGATFDGSVRAHVGSDARMLRLREALRQPELPANTIDLTEKLPLRRGGGGWYVLENQTVKLGANVQDSPTVPGTPPLQGGGALPTVSVRGSSFVLKNSLSTRDITSQDETSSPVTTCNSGSLELEDCVLRIEGDLDLYLPGSSPPSSASAPARTSPSVPPVANIRGNNATLIVTGDLTLSNGNLNALDMGMVIYCGGLFCQAAGTYNGLIIAREKALFFPGAGNGLHINGGLLVGGSRSFCLPGQLEIPFGLWGTHLTYDPRYLKPLQATGSHELLVLRKVP